MTIIDDLVAFASEAKATVSETPGGHSMTWDHGMYAHHLWLQKVSGSTAKANGAAHASRR